MSVYYGRDPPWLCSCNCTNINTWMVHVNSLIIFVLLLVWCQQSLHALTTFCYFVGFFQQILVFFHFTFFFFQFGKKLGNSLKYVATTKHFRPSFHPQDTFKISTTWAAPRIVVIRNRHETLTPLSYHCNGSPIPYKIRKLKFENDAQ